MTRLKIYFTNHSELQQYKTVFLARLIPNCDQKPSFSMSTAVRIYLNNTINHTNRCTNSRVAPASTG